MKTGDPDQGRAQETVDPNTGKLLFFSKLETGQ